MTGGISAPDLATAALLGHNDWLENIRADASSDSYASKVIRNKPPYLKDACWYDGVKYEEPLTLDPSAKCNKLMPVFGTVRLAAGGSLVDRAQVRTEAGDGDRLQGGVHAGRVSAAQYYLRARCM